MSDDAAALSVPPEAAWGPTFDVGRATDAYIATVPAADREKSDAYFEGGYWIELVVHADHRRGLRAAAALPVRGARARLGGGARRRTVPAVARRRRRLHRRLSLLTLPWSLYTGYFREHQYAMSNHTLGGFLGEWALNVAISTRLPRPRDRGALPAGAARARALGLVGDGRHRPC